MNTAVQSQKVVSVYFTSKQILPFDIAEQNTVAIIIFCISSCNELNLFIDLLINVWNNMQYVINMPTYLPTLQCQDKQR